MTDGKFYALVIGSAVGACLFVGALVPHEKPTPVARPHAAVADPCAVSGAIPNCRAILSGEIAAPKFAETSTLDYGPHDPQTLSEVPNGPVTTGSVSTPNPGLDRLEAGIEERRLHARVLDAERRYDLIKRNIYDPMGRLR